MKPDTDHGCSSRSFSWPPIFPCLASSPEQRWEPPPTNVAHNYILPLALAGFATLTDRREALPYALIWIAHIGLDRALGYGLKYGSGFGHTHLGWIGKGNAEKTPAAS